MDAPQGFRRSWLHWFTCPSCAHRSFFSYSAGRLGPDGKTIAVDYWCASCGCLCTLKDQWRLPAITLLCSLALFVSLYWLMIDGLGKPNVVWVLLWIACAVVGVNALLFLIGRFTNQYVATNRSEP